MPIFVYEGERTCPAEMEGTFVWWEVVVFRFYRNSRKWVKKKKSAVDIACPQFQKGNETLKSEALEWGIFEMLLKLLGKLRMWVQTMHFRPLCHSLVSTRKIGISESDTIFELLTASRHVNIFSHEQTFCPRNLLLVMQRESVCVGGWDDGQPSREPAQKLSWEGWGSQDCLYF